jgi:type IV pilus assembly protein PilV
MSMMPSTPKQRGFTLVEILVAVLVLSIGLLGLAGLQATSLRNSTSAAERTQATFLAYDIIERMRANKDAAETGGYDTALNTAPSGTTNCQTSGAACSAADMAAFDLNQWKCLLGKWSSNTVCSTTLDIDRGLLPDGDASITRGANSIVTITVQWTDGRDADTVELPVRVRL